METPASPCHCWNQHRAGSHVQAGMLPNRSGDLSRTSGAVGNTGRPKTTRCVQRARSTSQAPKNKKESSRVDRHHEESESAATWISADAEITVRGLQGGSPDLESQSSGSPSAGNLLAEEAVLSNDGGHNPDGSVHPEYGLFSIESCKRFKRKRLLRWGRASGAGGLRKRKSESRQSSNPLFEGDDPKGGASSVICTTPMVLLCSRIHPLIRDSASVKTVPFYVGGGGTTQRMDAKRFLASGDDSQCVPTSPQSEANSEGKHCDYPWLELAVITFFFIRSFAEPVYALWSWADYTVFNKEKYQGDLSWKSLQNCKEVRTTIVALLPWPEDMTLPKLSHTDLDGDRKLRNALKSETRSTGSRQDSKRYKYLVSTSKDDKLKLQKSTSKEDSLKSHDSLPYLPNREGSSGHWDTDRGVGISCAMYSSLPPVPEGTEQMSMNEVVGTGASGIREAYQDYLHSGNLRLALERLRDKDNDMKKWLDQWQNCWTKDGKVNIESPNQCHRACARQMQLMLDAWSEPPSSWGPPLIELQLPIRAINKRGLGVLLVHQCLLSSLLPRYGHKASIDEIAYMSAKAVKGDQRYYHPRVVYFWAVTALVVRVLIFVTARFASNILIALGLWVQFAGGAFDLDISAMVRGRVLKGCILQCGWGVRESSGKISSSEVTAALLAKWNANVAVESHALLNSFHTERWTENDDRRVEPMNLDLFQKSGGLLIGTVAIIPGRKDLRIRQLELQDQVYELGYSVWLNMEFPARRIISHSPCPVGGFLEYPEFYEDDSSSDEGEHAVT